MFIFIMFWYCSSTWKKSTTKNAEWASPREEWVGPDPPTSVQTPPEICTNPLRSVLCIGGGGPMHVYCNFLLLTSNKILFGSPTFFGLATPLNKCDVQLDMWTWCLLSQLKENKNEMLNPWFVYYWHLLQACAFSLSSVPLLVLIFQPQTCPEAKL